MIDPRLELFCRLCGIQTRYHDIWGKAHDVMPETVHAHARAMGVDWQEGGLDDAIARLQAAPWRKSLAPVQVVRRSDPARAVLLRLPEERAGRNVNYSLTLEDGTSQRASVRPMDLPVHERASVDGKSYAAYSLPVPDLAFGYHRFTLECDGATEAMSLIVVPNDCYLPEGFNSGGRVWGAALQLYALRSARGWGIGDFTDLRVAAEILGEQGAAVIGLNPLHALFPHNPAHVSPYSPSSRLFMNVLYLDVEAIAEFSQSAWAQEMVYAREFQQRLDKLRSSPTVDYVGVAAAKFPVLQVLYEHFREHHLKRNTPRAKVFRDYQARDGEWLYRHCVYEALQERFHRDDPNVWGWPMWPAAYRDPSAPEVAQWAQANVERVEYYQYLQWQVDRQIGVAERACYDHGMAVGLYQDLAVSVDRGGADTWALQSLYALNASIGAPPDELALQGQNWGLPPLVPQRLRDSAYGPFIETLRANMRHGGALRIDHVLGLMRLYWVPEGMSSANGAYVVYPLSDLLGILALESHRNRCLVIGEDLGTVPDELRTALAPMNVLSYRLFYFERTDAGDFKTPAEYPARALATITTHDLPTLAGYWKGQDIAERERLKFFPSDEVRDRQIVTRVQDRTRLLAALQREGLLPEGMTIDPASSPEMTPALARAVHVYLARSPSMLVMVQLEDIIGELYQPNLPGTVDEHPNWRRKLGMPIDEILKDARTLALFEALRAVRGPGVTPRSGPGNGNAVVPTSTYRLQFHKDFSFRQAEAIVPYLAQLGVSHCYASPYLKARAGSRHGYDIVDHSSLNPEIGSTADYDAFVAALQQHQLSQILDIVPNHMGVGSDNHWWLDVLENGASSLYATFFDIDWYPLKSELRGKVLLPVLGDHYGAVLEGGELTIEFDAAAGTLEAHYYTHRFPVDPSTYPSLLGRELDRLQTTLGIGHTRFAEYQSLVAAFTHLPARNERGQERVIERYRDKELHKRRLAELCAAEPLIRQHVQAIVAQYNQPPAHVSRDWLHELLEQQAYRLAFWRVASDEINYRRFFDINDLAALRMENRHAFYTTHRLISELVAQGKVNGLRVDHPDGLYDPLEYYRRLHSFVSVTNSGASKTGGREELYLVVEKILASHEQLPERWPVHGTTGYDFLNLVNGLLVDAHAEPKFDAAYARIIGREVDFDEILAECKRLIMRVALASELSVLASHLNRLSETDWHARDFTLSSLRFVLRELVAYFPVYRTYIRNGNVSADDRRYVEMAVARAKKHNPATDVSAFDFVRRMLLLEGLENEAETYRNAVIDFAMRVQQYTAPVMAKGMEDTAFYMYNRFLSLNEVGGDPRRFGLSIDAFHHANSARASRFPHSMLATSTHDTKRSEDVRARLNVLSEIPDAWRTAVMRWIRLNRSKRKKLDDGFAPDRNDEYLLYQAMVGAWPLEGIEGAAREAFRERIEAYLLKAVREAKVRTSWINQNIQYETAIQEFIRALLAPDPNMFLDDFTAFVRRLVRPGLYNSLSQVILKLTAPGVPDIYQGNELWDFSLVDPDNRRAVDYQRRRMLLTGLQAEFKAPTPARVRALLENLEDGRAKLYLTWKTLSFRNAHAAIFRDGDYAALAADGPAQEHICAFARRHAGQCVVAVAPRCMMRWGSEEAPPLGAIWRDSRIEVPADGVYDNVLTGEALRTELHEGRPTLPVSAVLGSFPVALLHSRPR